MIAREIRGVCVALRRPWGALSSGQPGMTPVSPRRMKTRLSCRVTLTPALSQGEGDAERAWRDFRANGHGDQRHPRPSKARLAMAVSLTPALSRRARERGSALRATFIVMGGHDDQRRPEAWEPLLAVAVSTTSVARGERHRPNERADHSSLWSAPMDPGVRPSPGGDRLGGYWPPTAALSGPRTRR